LSPGKLNLREHQAKLINEVLFMRVISVVVILAGFLSSSASAAPTACELISAADMSAILGSAVAAVADDRGGQTKCTYESAGDESAEPTPRCS
jgi:hypothetical protein